MSIKVVDLQNEEVDKAFLNSNPVGVEAKEDAPTIETVEEAPKEEEPEIVNEVVETEEPKDEVKEEVKEEVKPKRQTQKDRIQCPKCLKEVSLKTYRYTHEKICQGQLSEKPVKPHTNPRPKGKAKPKQPPKLHEVASKQRAPPEVYYSESDDDEPQQPMLKKKNKQPAQQTFNPTAVLAQQYQFLQNQMIQQKQERYNNLCMNMFSSKSKKR